jgi:hemerythrin superfamily protein
MAKKDRGTSESKSRGQNRTERSEGLLSRLGLAGSNDPDAAEKPMKATDMLKKDHRKVEELFSEYEDQASRARKKEIVDQISRELDIHAQLEEKIFYQSIKSAKEEDPKKIVRESFEEHKIVKTLIAELAGMNPSDAQYDAKVTVLKESVQHHVKEEEGELFPAAEKEFSDEQLQRLGEEMADYKEELREREERSVRPRARRSSSRSGGRQRQRPAEA